jgi:ABC-type lipoprotein release transport system permease subunit
VLYGVSAHDRFSFAAAATIAAVALASCMAPAVRAMRIDPLTELRR